MTFYQELPLRISPYIFDAGFFRLHWYGAMYILAFSTAILLVSYRLKTEKWPYTKETIYDIAIWIIIGILLGGRLGYVIIYNPSYYLNHASEIIWPFMDGKLVGIAGMSYHGGLLGGLFGGLFFTMKKNISWKKMTELFIPAVPLGYFFGRIGNFINGELYGRVTTHPLAMNFGDGLLRHPSQLYEAFFEGLVLFILLWIIKSKTWVKGRLLGIYLIGYAMTRFLLEYTREPDVHLGFVLGPLTMGQLLSIGMFLIGIIFTQKKYHLFK